MPSDTPSLSVVDLYSSLLSNLSQFNLIVSYQLQE
jgi:hypothetical protein